MPGALTQIAVGAHGAVWGINGEQKIFQYNGQGWDQIPGFLTQIKVGNGLDVWGINGAQDIYKYNGRGGWDNIPGKLSQISVGVDGAMWGLNSEGSIYAYNGLGGWNWVPGKLTQISVGSWGAVWGLAGQSIYQYNGQGGWNPIGGALTQISVGADGAVWGVNGADEIFQYNGFGGWNKLPGSLSQISVGADGSVWGVNRNQDVYHYNGLGGWDYTPAKLSSVVAAGDGSVWGLLGEQIFANSLNPTISIGINDPNIISMNQRVSSGDTALDYVIGDVCVDGADRPITGDPASCSRHRNIRIGEKFPYLVTDVDRRNGARYQANFSYPVPGTDGTLKVITTKNLQGPLNPNFKFRFNPAQDGFDLMETTSGYISIVRTSDGGCYDQAWQYSLGQLSMGWILFKTDMQSAQLEHPRWHIELTNPAPKDHQDCVNNSANAVLDIWNSPRPVLFESGKTLNTVVTYDYYSNDLSTSNTGLERYFFTKEYGFSRWEAWIPLAKCKDPNAAYCNPYDPANDAAYRCSNSNIPGVDSWGGQTWVRVDCRDTTSYVALNQPTLPLDGTMGQINNRYDIDLSSLVNDSH